MSDPKPTLPAAAPDAGEERTVQEMGEPTEYGDRICAMCNQQVPARHRCAAPDAGAPQERAGLLAALRSAKRHMRHADGCGLNLHKGQYRCSCGMLRADAEVQAAIEKLSYWEADGDV